MWKILKRHRNLKAEILLLLLLQPGILFWGKTAQSAEEELKLYARSAVLIDGSSGRILYGKEETIPLPMASTTKIMTCVIALEEADENMVCTASEHAAKQPQVRLGMQKGQSYYLKDLLYSLMLESHNDTAVCIAENVAGSVESFAEKMNAKAQEIGCNDTYYITPNGLDGEDENGIHHTTAADLARVLRYCITQSVKKEKFLEITETMQYAFTDLSGENSYYCVNHNAFLQMMDGALTGKTGFTAKAGYCYVGALKRDDRLLIVALLACGWPGHRSWKWADTKVLMNYGMDHYTRYTLKGGAVPIAPARVKNGQKPEVGLKEREESLELLLGEEEKITRWIEVPRVLQAPIEKGTIVGMAYYRIGAECILSSPICVADGVKKRNLWYEAARAARALLL